MFHSRGLHLIFVLEAQPQLILNPPVGVNVEDK